jgi:hypothetical protein
MKKWDDERFEMQITSSSAGYVAVLSHYSRPQMENTMELWI